MVLRTAETSANLHFQGRKPTGDVSHIPSSRLSLLSARLAVTFPASEYHHPWPVLIYVASWTKAGVQTACLGSLCDSRMARTQAGDITTASPMPYLLCHHVISVTQVTSSLPSLLLHYIILGKNGTKRYVRTKYITILLFTHQDVNTLL